MSLVPSYLRLALRISRFRFWIYTAGTYVVGYALGASQLQDFLQPDYFVYLLYFFFPANLLIYGINDFWDEETDRLNPKKDGKEVRVSHEQRRALLRLLYVVIGLSLLLMLFQDWTERGIFALFLFLSYGYSAPPLRFKGRPILDSASNFLYVVPGVFAYYLASGELPPLIFVVAGFAHIFAMHLFSAIPDIDYDRGAGVRTGAVLMGRRTSLLVCLLCWGVLSAIVLYLAELQPLSWLVLIYPTIPMALLMSQDLSVERIYWWFPYVNTTLGGLLWVSLVWSILG